ncbi:hypothetical protein EDB80DRAFT_838956, partial [Ilyonectria destructans]
ERPRTPCKRRAPGSEAGYSLSGQSRQWSERSGRLLPQKHLQILRLSPHGIEFRDLTHFNDKPHSLEVLLEVVDVIMEGKGIISSSAREELELAAQSHKDFKWVLRSSEYFSDTRGNVGHTPSLEDVLNVVAAAAECSTYGHPEANWNLEVHQQVLKLAFRPPYQAPFKHLLRLHRSTTAAITPTYGKPSILKKVDFCISVEPENDESLKATTATSTQPAILRFRDTLPDRILNFTDFAPLEKRPIALSIETKKPSEGFDSAKLQLGVWQMAHWSFLRYLAERPIAEAQAEAEGGEKTDGSIKLPPFIPGIIIQGHDWHLNFTTSEGEQTLFWQKVLIGSTSSAKGVYQIVHILQVLRQWVKDEYWPWLRDVIL